MRARRLACSGMGVPFCALSLVQAMSFFWMRQITPQTFSIIIQPMPPPTFGGVRKASSRRTSASALATISGPIPRGSPTVMARRAFTIYIRSDT